MRVCWKTEPDPQQWRDNGAELVVAAAVVLAELFGVEVDLGEEFAVLGNDGQAVHQGGCGNDRVGPGAGIVVCMAVFRAERTERR